MAPQDTDRGSPDNSPSHSTAPPPREQPGNPRESNPGRPADSVPRRNATPPAAQQTTPVVLKQGAVAGVLAFVGGYLLTAVALYLDVSLPRGGNPADLATRIVNEFVEVGAQQILDAAGGEILLALRVVVWTFFSAQWIPLDGIASGLGRSVTQTVDVLTVTDKISEISLTTPVYYLIPVVCLLAAGLWIVRRIDTQSRYDAGVAGGQVLVGYLPCVLIAGTLSGLTVNLDFFVASATIATTPVMSSAALMGSIYAVAFGAAGGVLWLWLKTKQE